MDEDKVTLGVIVDENITISYVSVCNKYHVSEQVLLDFIEHGLFRDRVSFKERLDFDGNMLSRLESACRLYNDLQINPPGVVLALELLDRLDKINDELAVLKRHVG